MKTDSKEASYEAPLTRKIGLYIINPAKKCKASFFLEKGYSTFSFDKSRCLQDYVKNSDRISNGMTSCITLEIMQNKMQRQLHVFYTKKGYSTRGRNIEHFPFFLFLSFGILVKYYNLQLSQTTVNTLKNESSTVI